MRILHTSDWHLGQHFIGKSRQAEHQALIDWLLVQVDAHAVDAVLVAGDIFDTGTPPSYARELYSQLVVRLHGAGVALLLLGGNHDSVATLGENRSLLACLNTTVIGAAEDPAAQVVVLPLRGPGGKPGCVVCAAACSRQRSICCRSMFVSLRLLNTRMQGSQLGDRIKRWDAGTLTLKEQVADKQKLLEQERRIQSLDQHRQALQPGEACPLCGATEHPAIGAYQALDVSGTEAALQQKQTELEDLIADGQAVVARLEVIKDKQAERLSQQEKTTQHIGQWQAEWITATAISQVGTSPVPAAADWQNAENLAAGQQAATNQLAQLGDDLQACEAGEQNVQRALAAASQQTQALQAAKHQLELLQQAAQAAQACHTQLMHNIDTTQAEIATLEMSLQTALAEAGYTLPADPASWLVAREAEWKHWQRTQDQMQVLAQAITRQQAQRDVAQTQADLWTQRWTELQAAMGEQAIDLPAPVEVADEAVPAALAASVQAIDRLEKALAALDGRQAQAQATQASQAAALEAAAQTWQAALEGSPFADQAEFEAALLPEPERQRLATVRDTLHTAEQRASALHQAAHEKQAQLQAQALTSQTLEELEAHLAELKEQRATHSEKVGAHRALLNNDAQLRSNQQALFEQISSQTAEADLWQRLDGLIGSAKGDKFRKFAQGLTLDHLLQLANKHLARLHGRYLLRRKSTGELELEIVDAWQGDAARDTRTLSGGEGFLVSLALALALSDLVSNKTSIDSLFLDEGFGSLDGDTLEIALTALDSLNASGKMIGIISHVEAMKERIPAQIRVEKGGGIGHSRLVV